MRHSNLLIEHRTTSQLMLLVCFGLIPGALTQFYFLGWGVLINLILCALYAISAESIVLKIRGKNILSSVKDNSALLTGLLLGLALPPLLPWWMSFIGVYFAIIFAKHLYGGLGSNPFNPAMIGYLLLLISFPLAMTNWLPSSELSHLSITKSPDLLQSLELTFTGTTFNGEGNVLTLESFRQLADGFTMATPLDHIRTDLSQGLMISESLANKDNLININAWQWINLAYLIGGIYLLLFKLIRWHIPLSILAAIIVTSFILNNIDNEIYLGSIDHLFLGATMLSAFFIATDPVSASTTPKGRIIYGCLIGFIIVMIRSFGSYPDAFAFAIILLNIAVPTIDYYFRPIIYGDSIPITVEDQQAKKSDSNDKE